MRGLVIVAMLLLWSLAPAQAQRHGLEPPDWDVYVQPEFKTRVDYPAGMFSVREGPSERGTGERLATRDGRAQLSIYSMRNETRETPASYLRKHLGMSLSRSDYRRVTDTFFAISAHRDGIIYYSRCNFSSVAGGAVHCIDLRYPEREKRAWDGIVTRISRSLRPLVRTWG